MHLKHLNRLQVTQNKILRKVVDAPWFTRNVDIRKETITRLIMEFMKELSTKFHKTLPSVPNETNTDDPYGNPHLRDIQKFEQTNQLSNVSNMTTLTSTTNNYFFNLK